MCTSLTPKTISSVKFLRRELSPRSLVSEPAATPETMGRLLRPNSAVQPPSPSILQVTCSSRTAAMVRFGRWIALARLRRFKSTLPAFNSFSYSPCSPAWQWIIPEIFTYRMACGQYGKLIHPETRQSWRERSFQLVMVEITVPRPRQCLTRQLAWLLIPPATFTLPTG